MVQLLSVGLRNNKFELFRLSIDGNIRVVTRDEILNILLDGRKIHGIRIDSNRNIRVDKDVRRFNINNRKEVQNKRKENLNKQLEYENTAIKIRDTLKNSKDTLVFHGSLSGIHGNINVNCNKNECDFGPGFYTGEMIEQAEGRVSNTKESIIYAFKLDMNKVKSEKIAVYKFNDTILWAIFIGYNRKKIDLSDYKYLKAALDKILQYDIIVGLIADDKIADTYNSFCAGLISDVALNECIKYVKYGNQIVFKTDKSLMDISKLAEYKLVGSLKNNSIQWSRDAKHNMDSNIDRIIQDCYGKGRLIGKCLEAYNEKFKRK